MGRISHQDHAPPRVPPGKHQRQRECRRCALHGGSPEHPVEPCPEFRLEVGGRQLHQLPSRAPRLGPDDSAPATAQGEHGERPGGEKSLHGRVLVRFGVPDRAHHCGLPVGPGALADPGQFPDGRGPPVGADQYPAVDRRAVGKSGAHPARQLLEGLDGIRVRGHAESLEPGSQGSRQIVVRNDVPDRPLAKVITFKVQVQRNVALRDANPADRLRPRAHRPPNSDRLVQSPRSAGDGRRSRIAPRTARHGIGDPAIDTRGGERGRQRHSGKTGARDQHFRPERCLRHML